MDPGSAPRRKERRAARRPGNAGIQSRQRSVTVDICPAILRKQSGHRQSRPSDGIGRRKDSSEHQQGPERLQENSVPQLVQARRRAAGISNRFVMKEAAF
jgi:hypothetical protein